jgi:hypothetical protein
LKKIVVASSATAAPPENALPNPLTLCSIMAKPEANTGPADTNTRHATITNLTVLLIIPPLA